MLTIRSVEHPGKILLSAINNIGMKQKELAIRTGVSEKHISTVINGTKDISASFARKLDIALGEEIGTWLKRQNEYDQYMLEFEKENDITDEEISILKSMKELVDYFLDAGIMHNHCGDAEKVFQLRKILRVINLSVIPQITYNAAYRAQINASTNINPYILFAWQRMCEIRTEKTPITASFDTAKLKDSIPAIRQIMFEENPAEMVAKLKTVFSQCGIIFEVVRHFRGAPVQGFIKQLTS
ncbi:MAG: HigA family addiction module antitoxin, partial [Acutalibacteraceae bacterium]